MYGLYCNFVFRFLTGIIHSVFYAGLVELFAVKSCLLLNGPFGAKHSSTKCIVRVRLLNLNVSRLFEFS